MNTQQLKPVSYANAMVKFGETMYSVEVPGCNSCGRYHMMFRPFRLDELVGSDKEFIAVDYTVLQCSNNQLDFVAIKDTYSLFFGDFHKVVGGVKPNDNPTVSITYKSQAYKNSVQLRDAAVTVVMDCDVELGSTDMVIRLNDGFELFRYNGDGIAFSPERRLFKRVDFPNYYTYGYDDDKTDGATDQFGNYKTPAVVQSNVWFRSNEKVGEATIREDTFLIFPRLDCFVGDLFTDTAPSEPNKTTLFSSVSVTDGCGVKRYYHRIVLNSDADVEAVENRRSFSVQGRVIRLDNGDGSVVFWDAVMEAFSHMDMMLDKFVVYNNRQHHHMNGLLLDTPQTDNEDRTRNAPCCSCGLPQEPKGAEITD